MSQQILETISKLEKFFSLGNFNLTKNKKIFIGASIALIVVVIIAILIYIFFFEEIIGNVEGTFVMDKIDSNYSSTLTSSDIIKPRTGDSFTFSFWINITNYYKNHTLWRHLFHKGTPISKVNILDYAYWDNLTNDIDIQCPGVWLHPDKNSIRFAFTTINDKMYTQTEHALPVTEAPIYEVRESNIYQKKIEYCDVDNIPAGEDVNIIMTLDRRQVNIYMNGNIIKTCNLQGAPEHNNGDTYFNYENTYSGFISNFTYIPQIVKMSKIKQLHADKPGLLN